MRDFSTNKEIIKLHLKNKSFETLFLDCFGWEKRDEGFYWVILDASVQVSILAQKNGFKVYHVELDFDPSKDFRDKLVKKILSLEENYFLIISFEDWVFCEWNNPLEDQKLSHVVDGKGKNNNEFILVNKLIQFDEQVSGLSKQKISLQSEQCDQITKKFYKAFQAKVEEFKKSVKGFDDREDKSWYVSVLMNRLMFIYFLQKKGFLDNDKNYLLNKLEMVKKVEGKNKFKNFYAYFLLKLFHKGLGAQKRDKDLEKIIGRVPYLNGGLFELHELEEKYKKISIPDTSFEALFQFFESYEWNLNDGPLTSDNEINPSLMGFIFEKYVNQRELGAYYTGEDITRYLSSNCLAVNIVKKSLELGFDFFEGPHSIQNKLKDNFSKYLSQEALQGIYNKEAEIYVNYDLIRNSDPNEVASDEIGNPGETWGDCRERYEKFLEAYELVLSKGINKAELVVEYNFNFDLLVRDVISSVEEPKSALNIYSVLESLKILDPTCGSGAFLLSAMKELEPIYLIAVQRIRELYHNDNLDIEERECLDPVIERFEGYESERYFIYKNIILNNLFGVDLVHEATEICKLRLFLKLACEVNDASSFNPLPDIDFNVRCGNSLVGYVTIPSFLSDFTGGKRDSYERKIEVLRDVFYKFKNIQDSRTICHRELKKAKKVLVTKLKQLRVHFDQAYFKNYYKGYKPEQFPSWCNDHAPFHWCLEFLDVFSNNGFDLIVGNPPFLERNEVNYSYPALDSADNSVHAACVERSLSLLKDDGGLALVMPMGLVCSQRMKNLQETLENDRSVFYSNFAWRPAKLFDEVNRAISLFIAFPSSTPKTMSTRYIKWKADHRSTLFKKLTYAEVERDRETHWVPKIGMPIETKILNKLFKINELFGETLTKSGKNHVYYKSTGGLYWKIFSLAPPKFIKDGKRVPSSREKVLTFESQEHAFAASALLSSNLFWWWYTLSTTLRDLNPSDIKNFPTPKHLLSHKGLIKLGRKFQDDLQGNSLMKTRVHKKTKSKTKGQSFNVSMSKEIIDKIDMVLADCYGLSKDEVNFIINYDYKFRMSKECGKKEGPGVREAA